MTACAFQVILCFERKDALPSICGIIFQTHPVFTDSGVDVIYLQSMLAVALKVML